MVNLTDADICSVIQAERKSATDAERERIAQMIERADNTMMKQDKLAKHVRGLKD